MLIGYARVSTPDQDLTLQMDALNAAGCEHIATDKASGASIVRPGLTEALGKARKGDTLVIWKLDRLGRSMKGLVDLAAELSARGIALRSLTDGIDTATHTGRLVFHILGSIAEMERELIRERTMAGLAARRKAGGGGGRKSVMTPRKRDMAVKLLAAGDRPQDVAEAVGVSVSTFYRHFPASGRVVPAEGT
jgi:DNA invertase Pin-like site-specific DNA recombinase